MAYDSRRFLSASQLATYSRCPQLYKLQKIDKVPSPPAAWLVKGQAVHSTFEGWEANDRNIPVDFAYEQSWEENLADYVTQYPDLDTWIKTPRVNTVKRDLELRKADGLLEVQRYVARAEAEAHLWEVARLPSGDLALEIPFRINYDTFVVTGRIDVVQRWKHDGSLTVGDYKTGSDSSENYRQLGTYRVGLLEDFGIDVTYGTYWYTKLDRSSGWIDLSRYTKEFLYNQYAALDRAIKSEVFIPSPEKNKCKLCSVRQHCSEMKDN